MNCVILLDLFLGVLIDLDMIYRVKSLAERYLYKNLISLDSAFMSQSTMKEAIYKNWHKTKIFSD
jgi:hypothetical protein